MFLYTTRPAPLFSLGPHGAVIVAENGACDVFGLNNPNARWSDDDHIKLASFTVMGNGPILKSDICILLLTSILCCIFRFFSLT